MKDIVTKLAAMIHHYDEATAFAIEFWDGDIISFGTLPRYTFRLKTEDCARNIIENGFSGVGMSVMTGELEIDPFWKRPVP